MYGVGIKTLLYKFSRNTSINVKQRKYLRKLIQHNRRCHKQVHWVVLLPYRQFREKLLTKSYLRNEACEILTVVVVQTRYNITVPLSFSIIYILVQWKILLNISFSSLFEMKKKQRNNNVSFFLTVKCTFCRRLVQKTLVGGVFGGCKKS